MIEIDETGFNESLNRIAASDDGKILLAWLGDWCGFGRVKIGSDLETTYANANMERLYLMLRERIKPEHLKKIEYDYKRKAVSNERRTNTRDK